MQLHTVHIPELVFTYQLASACMTTGTHNVICVNEVCAGHRAVPVNMTGLWLKGRHLVFSLTYSLLTSEKRRATDRCLTQLTAHVPVELGVEIGRVDAIG